MYSRFFTVVTALVALNSCALKRDYKAGVQEGINRTVAVPDSILTEADIQQLPPAVQRYLRYCGVVGKPRVKNFRVSFTGQLRKKGPDSAWMDFSSVQYNFIDTPTRLFYMKAVMKHLPVRGLHCYKNGSAFMDIRLLGLLKVQYAKGPAMDTAETVTFFNDMCCMAPATLIDKRIRWETLDSNRVKAWFTYNGITVWALLYFNPDGQLVNFVSPNRFALMDDGTMKQLQWQTPLKNYKEINGYRLPGYAEAIYTYPDGDFCYGTFSLTGVEYNCR